MRVAGIIAEYNPFHNGHLYHLRSTREKTGCDYVIAVMAGCFTQRGEAAIADKWERARTALISGVDLVIELPALFAMRPAQFFARGGVRLLGALGVVDDLSFGCETDDLNVLTEMVRLLRDEPPEMKKLLREGLERGESYPRAQGRALETMLGLSTGTANAPNLALALEYLKENARLNRPMQPLAVKRTTPYHDLSVNDMASASAIRAALRRGEDVGRALPAGLSGDLSREDGLDDLLLYRLRGMTAEELRGLHDMPEGLEMRILQMADQSASREELTERVKCKRYTRARVSRCLTGALLGMDAQLCSRYVCPPYARVLGFRERARPLMRRIARVGGIPLVTDPARIREDPCFMLERRATDLWGLGTSCERFRRAGRDMTERVLMVP